METKKQNTYKAPKIKGVTTCTYCVLTESEEIRYYEENGQWPDPAK